MKIASIAATPLFVPYKEPFHWAWGVVDGARVVLVEICTDDGISGFGESIASPCPTAVTWFIRQAAELLIGQDPFHNTRLMHEAHTRLFKTLGAGSAPRFAGQVLAGLEMALWDVMGKATGRPVHDLLGGAARDHIPYFGFPQGGTPTEISHAARRLVKQGFELIYVKLGRGDRLDLDTVAAVRKAIGPRTRLRVDPNESWSPNRAIRMINKLTEWDVELVEQPTVAESLSALRHVRTAGHVAIAADQAAFTPFDVFDVCRQHAADLIVLGPHETGGLSRFLKAAHIAEAAGLDVCLHGLYETGITTCASHQVGAVTPNLDDANQIMTPFLSWDLIAGPNLVPTGGRLPLLQGPGLGFDIDRDAITRAHRAFLDSLDGAKEAESRPAGEMAG